MLRNLNNLIRNNSTRQFAVKANPNCAEKPQRIPLITCKNTSLNIYSDEMSPKSKIGDISLASKGWKHRKSKGDFFTIHPTVELNEAFNILEDVDTLRKSRINPQLIENLKSELEIERLTSTQQQARQLILDMNHVLIAAETGCGKTLAYLVPIVQQILERSARQDRRELNTPLGLIVTPGRELAAQIGDVIKKLCKGLNVNTKIILGGNTRKLMMNPDFEDVDILVATMGVISKLTTTGIYRMNQVRHVVLDEADTLLDDSFSEKLCYFLSKFPFYKNHLQDLSDKIVGTQLILVSATMPRNIEELLKQVIDTETIHEVASPNLHYLMSHIKHKFLRMNKSDRPGQLLTLVKTELNKNRPLIVFGNKSVTSDFVSLFLNDTGVKCVNLNGDMPMKVRMGQFERFQGGEVDVLATTDVASRGLNTTRACGVINFDFPLHISDYIHRCGRIGRVGSLFKCTITNFVSSRREIDIVQKIEHAARIGGLLPDVNANITQLIHKEILKQIKEEEKNIF